MGRMAQSRAGQSAYVVVVVVDIAAVAVAVELGFADAAGSTAVEADVVGVFPRKE